MAIYRPRMVEQDDGSVRQWDNCTMASAAMAIDRHTLGRIRTTGARMRACQYDQSGGTDLSDAKTAWSRCFGQYLDVRLKITWSTFISAVKAGRGAIVVGWYSYIPRVYRGQDSSWFGHAVYINEVRTSDGALLMYDPLREIAVWIPQIYIKRFAGAMRTTSGTLGYGYVQTGFTRVTSAIAVPLPPKPTTTTSSVTLRFGAIAKPANYYQAKVAAKQRRSPYIRSDNVLRTVPAGHKFRIYQRTDKGTNVAGSTSWYGDATGTIWMHTSVLKDIPG